MKYKHLNLKYAMINAFYFMLVCGTFGYANNYLQLKGISTGIIGMILTAISILALLGQTGMAPYIDRSKTWNEKKYILATLSVSVLCFILMILFGNLPTLVLVLTIIGFSATSMGIPYLNSIAFIYEQEGQKINYGLGRGVGSSAYAVAGLLIGQLIHLKDASVLPYWLLVMAILTMLVVWTLQVPEKKVEEHHDQAKQSGSYLKFAKKYKDILVVICALVMIYFCHSIINNFMLNVVSEIGGDAASQGNATFIQAMVELPTMFGFALLLKKFKIDSLMIYAAIFYSLKHIIILLAPNMGMFYVAMVLQMVSYALIVPSTVYFADEHIEAEDRNQGQVLFGATATVGGLFASFIGGSLIANVGIHTTLLIGTISSIIGTLLMVYGVTKLRKK